MSVASYRYCGRNFTAAELKVIDNIIRTPDHPVRAEISRRVCRELRWYRPNGQLKDMSCRVALLRMQRDGLISLPLPRNGNGNGNIRIRLNAHSAPGSELSGRVDNYPFDIEIVDSTEQSRLWNEYIARYHYLGYTPLPGAQIRYMVKSDQKVLAVLGFGAAAWKMAPRDRWLGWTTAQRQCRLPFIANNSRFLILPWVRVKNLASAVIGAIARRIQSDWQMRYHHPIYMLETLVEKKRFAGTCYRAANWIHLGCTQGRGKLDRKHRRPFPVKDIYVYPLKKNFQKILTNAAD